MKGFKGFDKDFKCRGMQYEVGKEYKHDGPISLCNSGLHFVLHPFDALNYYSRREGSRFAEVEADGVCAEEKGDTKRAASKLVIKAELTIKELIDASVKFVLSHAKTTQAKEQKECAAATGNSGHAAATGNYGHAAATGNYGHAAATGDSGHAAATGKNGIAAAFGIDGKAKGSVGNWIMCAEWHETKDGWAVKSVKTAKIDGKKLKADTFYQLNRGKFTEAK